MDAFDEFSEELGQKLWCVFQMSTGSNLNMGTLTNLALANHLTSPSIQCRFIIAMD